MNTALSRMNSHFPGMLAGSVFDDIFDNFFNDMPSYVKRSTQGYPVVDIYKDDSGNTVMEFALAGFSKEELNVEVKPDERSLTVTATSADKDYVADRRIARRSFTRTYVNYDNDLDLLNANATFENGLLSIVVPKCKEEQPVSIGIK